MFDSFHANMNCVQLIIIDVCLSSDPHIRVICEGSCDTEDWSNDDKFSFDHRNKLQFTIYSHRKQMIYTVVILHCFTI